MAPRPRTCAGGPGSKFRPASNPSACLFTSTRLATRSSCGCCPPTEGDGAGQFFGGFRELEITHSIESTEGDGVPRLRTEILADTPPAPALADSFFGAVTWRPQRWIVRGGQAGDQGLELVPGGEAWLHTDAMTGEIRGQIFCPASAHSLPMVEVVWYKGGRLQLMQHGRVEPGRPFDFRVWTAEPGGWIGILVENEDRVAPVQVRVTDSTLIP